MPPKVTKATRAGKNGRVIYCPKCGNGDHVYNMGWIGKTCQSCWQLVDRLEWFLEPPDKAALPQPLPPYFVFYAPDNHVLCYGDGTETDIDVICRDGPANIREGGHIVDNAPYLAAGKTKALERLKTRQRG